MSFILQVSKVFNLNKRFYFIPLLFINKNQTAYTIIIKRIDFMFKRIKHIIYKSPNANELKKEYKAKIVIGVICFATIVAIILGFLFFPLDNVAIPSFYLNEIIWAIIFSIILTTGAISFMLITNQGANKKTFLYFLICVLILTINFYLAHIFHLFYLCLFICAFLLYFAFLLLHELKKTNLTAYFLFVPFCIFSIYNVIIYYFLAMLN